MPCKFLYQNHPVLNCIFFLESHASFVSFPHFSWILRLYFKDKNCLCLTNPDSQTVMLKCPLSLGLYCLFASTSLNQPVSAPSSCLFLVLVHCSSLSLRIADTVISCLDCCNCFFTSLPCPSQCLPIVTLLTCKSSLLSPPLKTQKGLFISPKVLTVTSS